MKYNHSYKILFFFIIFLFPFAANAQKKSKNKKEPKQTVEQAAFNPTMFEALQWRNIGPYRGGRSVAVTGVEGDPLHYYFGSVGGGVWETKDAGMNWENISDGYFQSGSVGAIAIAPNDKNIIYVGMGEHAVRGVMTSHGDGMYKSTDAGKSWTHIGLFDSRHIAEICVHPDNPDLVYVAVQGALWNGSEERGVYRSKDGGKQWERVLYINEHTGAADLSIDPNNPRILYAGMWDHQRLPWQVRSGGEGSGIYRSKDGGDSWVAINEGLPELMGKVAVDVSPAQSSRLYANIEAEGKTAGVYRSDNSGESWTQVNADRVTVARAWYYIEIFADPVNADVVYVLNAPVLKSIDGGKSFETVPVAHTDQHDMWINPKNTQNIILANDGGVCISFNGGKTWSTQNNQPTAQFYRVITDDQFPYHVYGGQQDNSTVCITSRTNYGGITENDWYPVAGGESAFIAFNNPGDPEMVYGTSIQGFITSYDRATKMEKDIMVYPAINLGTIPIDQKYRFNWNGPLIHNQMDPKILYHGGNKLLKSDNEGLAWKEISPDLTRNDIEKHSTTGIPFTNEAAGGEVYNTISYIASSGFDKNEIWVGSDDGLVHRTTDEGENWKDVSPPVEGESLINSIELSIHDPATVYLAVTRYKFGDLQPMVYVTHDHGVNWKNMVKGLPKDNFVRVVREDHRVKGLLYAGTENGLYISFNGGEYWEKMQLNLPVCPITDLTTKDNDLIAATSGRAFWILDDLSALQQSVGKPDSTAVTLFDPKTTYKYSLATGGQANSGKNPPAGMLIDYYLPHGFSDSLELSLEIFDEQGQIIRTLKNKKPKDFKTWAGGPKAPKLISSKPGLNRVNWDMKREDLPAVEGVFMMGSYQGSFVGPGTYTLRLRQGDEVQEQKVDILADPRLDASTEDFEAQQALLVEIESKIADIHRSVAQFRSVKDQLDRQLKLLENIEGLDSLKLKGEKVKESIEAWEGHLIQSKQKTFQDVINFENKLNAEYNMLRGRIDGYDPKPTEGVKIRLKDLNSAWEKQEQELDRIIKEEVGGFNMLYKESNLPALIIPKSDTGKA